MIVRQSTENPTDFFVSLTLDEYELLRKTTGPNECDYEKVLKDIIDNGIHKKQT